MSNPFKTPEFKRLFKEWNQVLEQEGLSEIEELQLPFSLRKSEHRTDKIKEKDRYYELAFDLLQTFKFKNDMYQYIWALHCNGITVRDISKMINQKKFSKTTVNRIIIEIEMESGLKNGR